MPLSDARIRSLKPQERDFKVGDFGGLFLLVKKTVSKSLRFKYHVQGKEKLMAFGDHPHVGLAKAWALGDEAKSKLAAGLDPGEEKKSAKRVAEAAIKETFASIADEYLGKMRAEKKAPATLDKADWLLGMAKTEPHRVCRRLQLLSRMEHHEQDDEQVGGHEAPHAHHKAKIQGLINR